VVRLWLAVGLLLIALCGCRSNRESSQLVVSSSAVAAQSAPPVESPRRCGEGTSERCLAAEYCDDPHGLCGRRAQLSGVCRPRPTDCEKHEDPVCACDGRIYRNPCQAHAAGTDESLNGGCEQQLPGKIACGPRYCEAQTSYCEIVLSDVAELPSDFTCKALPPACRAAFGAGKPSCSCLPEGTRCASFCVVVDAKTAKSLRLTCVGGY
jgi:hypothetical protein